MDMEKLMIYLIGYPIGILLVVVIVTIIFIDIEKNEKEKMEKMYNEMIKKLGE